MTTGRSGPSWLWLLALFTAAGFVEAGFYGQVSAFMPLYLPHLGTVITQTSVLAVFPVAAVATLAGIGALIVAARLSPGKSA